MSVLLIDNYDSFTFNLFQQLSVCGATVEVMKNDQLTLEDICRKKPSHIVLSPGPGTPADAGICMKVIRAFAGTIPILGVCLGHQCIAAVFSPEKLKSVVHAPQLVHGKTSAIRHSGNGILAGIPSPFRAARYHSLIVKHLPPDFELMGSTDTRLIMGMMHKTWPLFGVQFHPESFLTEHCDRLIKNFLATQA